MRLQCLCVCALNHIINVIFLHDSDLRYDQGFKIIFFFRSFFNILNEL